MDGEVLYSVAQFPSGGTAVVLNSWYRAEEKILLWPPSKITLTKAIKERMQPNEKWTVYKDVRLLSSCENHAEAKRREKKYVTTSCPTSAIETDDERDQQEKKKRKSKPNSNYANSDSDDQSSADSDKKRRFAKAPHLDFPGETPKSRHSNSSPGLSSVRSLEQEMQDVSDGSYSHVHWLSNDTDVLSCDPNNNGAAQYHQLHVPKPPIDLHAQRLMSPQQAFESTAEAVHYQQLQVPKPVHAQQMMSPQQAFESTAEAVQYPQQLMSPRQATSTAKVVQYQQLQIPKPRPVHAQQLMSPKQATSTGLYGHAVQYNTPSGPPQSAQNDFCSGNYSQYHPMPVPGHGCNDGNGQSSDTSQLLKDIALQKITAMLSEVLVEVKELSRDVQLIKHQLAEGSPEAAAAATPMPIQLPLSTEEDFLLAESFLEDESIRKRMISRLALVGGTDTCDLIRRMLAAALTNGLASIFNWTGKHDKRCYTFKKAFKNTKLQSCLWAAAQRSDRNLTQLIYERAVKAWLQFAPSRQGGIPRNALEQQDPDAGGTSAGSLPL